MLKQATGEVALPAQRGGEEASGLLQATTQHEMLAQPGGYDKVAICPSRLVTAGAVLLTTAPLLITAASLLAVSPAEPAPSTIGVHRTPDSSLIEWRDDDSFALLRLSRRVLAGRAIRTLAAPTPEAGSACETISVARGGSLQISTATSGHWYGGPSFSRAFWPINALAVVSQPWRSNDMLADRDALGSVLEATWLTSTGAMLRVLARSGAFDFSFNQPPSADALFDAGREADGQLVITPSTGLPVLVEMCAHANVREAAEGLLARLPRPASPQSPSLELLRAPVRAS